MIDGMEREPEPTAYLVKTFGGSVFVTLSQIEASDNEIGGYGTYEPLYTRQNIKDAFDEN